MEHQQTQQVLTYAEGDLIQFSKAQIICQQCNCSITNRKGKGLALTISQQLGVDIYINRNQPDTVEPGKPRDNFTHHQAFDSVTNKKVIDSYQNRIMWFERCLFTLQNYMLHHQIKTVAFPYLIGCGLAGGDWKDYSQKLQQFATLLKEKQPDSVIYVVKFGNQE